MALLESSQNPLPRGDRRPGRARLRLPEALSRWAHDPLLPLVAAVLVTLLLGMVPLVGALFAPLRLFVTLVHESSHAIVALVTGGHVDALRVDPNGAGHVLYRGRGFFGAILVYSAGYLGAVGYGAFLLAIARRPGAARPVLSVSAVVFGCLTVLFGLPSVFTVVVGLAAAVALGWAARRASPAAAAFLAAFLGLRCAVSGLGDVIGLVAFPRFQLFGPRPVNDATILASITGVPAIVWALLWSAIAIAVLAVALRSWWPGAGSSGARDTDDPFGPDPLR